jgi:hypothetical protein
LSAVPFLRVLSVRLTGRPCPLEPERFDRVHHFC